MEINPNDLVLTIEKLFADEPVCSPKLEVAVRLLIAQNSALKEDNDALNEQLALLKKAIYGQKSEKTEIVLENR